MSDSFKLPDGSTIGTGLLVPLSRPVGKFPDFTVHQPRMSLQEIIDLLKARSFDARREFGPDWVKNQKNKSSCNGFAGAAALTRARVRRGLPRVDLSGAYLYSLINGGRDNGSMLDDGMEALQKQGCATEATVPWDRIYRGQYDTRKADAEAAANRAFECYETGNELDLAAGLALGFEGVVAVHADDRYVNYKGGGTVPAVNGPGNHAVCVDDVKWDGSRLLYDVCGSWGTSWGEQGRGWHTWDGNFASTTNYHLFYLIRSSTDDPQDPNNPPPVTQ